MVISNNSGRRNDSPLPYHTPREHMFGFYVYVLGKARPMYTDVLYRSY